MKTRARALCLMSLLLLCACESNPKKRWALTAGAAASGLAIGAATAPKDENQAQHAVYWGAILGLGASLLANHLYNDQTQIELLQKENQKLKAEMDLIQTGNKILVDQGKGKFKNPNMGETEHQGRKANWKMYQIDRWVKEGPDKLYHQDKMVEITPATEAP